MIIFGAVTVLLEFQIPPYVSRWAPFLFSFLGRGICELISALFPCVFVIVGDGSMEMVGYLGEVCPGERVG